jgi:hypothetical protein
MPPFNLKLIQKQNNVISCDIPYVRSLAVLIVQQSLANCHGYFNENLLLEKLWLQVVMWNVLG